MDDEVWTTRDGTRIAVGDMSEGHVRNALRMVLCRRREVAERRRERLLDELWAGTDPQEMMNDQYRRDLANPAIFFPLLEGGVHGSEELYRKYAGSI